MAKEHVWDWGLDLATWKGTLVWHITGHAQACPCPIFSTYSKLFIRVQQWYIISLPLLQQLFNFCLGLSICVCLHICLFGWTWWRHSRLALRRLLVYSWLDHIPFRSHVMLLSGICNVLLWVLEHLLNKSFPVSVSVLVDSFLKYPEQSPQFGSNGNSGNVHLFLKTQTFLLQNVWWIANRLCLSVLMLSCTATIMC